MFALPPIRSRRACLQCQNCLHLRTFDLDSPEKPAAVQTGQSHSQWLIALLVFASQSNKGIIMNKIAQSLFACSASLACSVASAAIIGPQAYSSQADSPFVAGSFGYFHLEDVEDNLINTPGLTASGSGLCIAGSSCFANSGLTDSVGNGGNGNLGRSIWAQGAAGITLQFDAGILGSLPTAVGLVWTDGSGAITFQAFDENGLLLGTATGNHADGSFSGTLADDRFYGATNATGISRVTITNGSGGIEIDHVQYGGKASGSVPLPNSLALLALGGVLALGARYKRAS